MSAILKKGGSSRLIVENFSQFKSVVIPAGFKLKDIFVKKSGTTAGNIKIGTSIVNAVAEQISVTDLTAPTGAGDLTITLRGGTPVVITLVGTETLEDMIALILAETYEGWTVEATGLDSILFTATVPGAKTGITTFNDGTTGVTETGPTLEVTGANATVGEQVVASTALSTTNGNISALTLVSNLFAVDTTLYVGVDSLATGDLAFHIQKLF
jgi:hypothetical protein